jgi:FkbM family methyltransferase
VSDLAVRPSAVDPPEVAEILWRGFGGDTGWDIGANCGQSLFYLTRACSRVLAFEPAAESCAYLTDQFGHLPGLQVYQLAVSDHDGTLQLAAIPQLMETGQLVTPGTRGMEWDPGDWDAVPVRTVPASTADALAGRLGVPDFAKVDTEGHEGHVLRGAAGLLRRGTTGWLIEFHSPELHETCLGLLRDAGYDPETIRHPHYPPGGAMWRQHGWIRAPAPR